MSEKKSESVVCGARILGPRVGNRVVLWIKHCARRTKDGSGRCPDHRGPGPFGPGAVR